MAAEQFNSVVIIFHDAQEKSICVTWQVPDRYKDLAAIGKGAYGNVCSAYDKETKQKVAIKKLARPFETPIHAKRTYRELRLLRHMKHDNVIGLLDVFTPQNNQRDFQDIYFVTHLMGGDLCTVMRSPELTDKHVQFLVYQMLRGLKDLKPSNIAVNDDCELRILDFGLAREAQDIMTGYVATRWYRAPEIMLNWMHYTQTVDIWSAGCIMAEMVSGSPLFPGTDAISQLNLILELVGVPGEALLSKIECQDARTYIASLHPAPPKDFKNVFPDASLEAVDLLKKMLELDPERRITAKDALAHPYLVSYHDVADEPVCDEPFEEQDWKRLVFQDVHTFPRPGASVKKLSSNLESPELVLTNPEVQMPITDKRPVGDRESDVFVPVPKRSRNELTVAGNDDHH